MNIRNFNISIVFDVHACYVFIYWGLGLSALRMKRSGQHISIYRFRCFCSVLLGRAWRGLYVPTADLQPCRDFRKYKTMDVFDGANLGEVLKADKRIVFKHRLEDQWYYAQRRLKDSACIVWPMIWKKMKKSTQEYFEAQLGRLPPPCGAINHTPNNEVFKNISIK